MKKMKAIFIVAGFVAIIIGAVWLDYWVWRKVPRSPDVDIPVSLRKCDGAMAKLESCQSLENGSFRLWLYFSKREEKACA